MSHSEKRGIIGTRLWESNVAPLRRGAGFSPERRAFDEELALFERQARDEAGRGEGPAGETSGPRTDTAA